MYFTQEDYKKIEAWLYQRTVRDTELPDALPINGSEKIPIVQGNRNKVVDFNTFVENVVNASPSYFYNVNSASCKPRLTLEEAISLVPFSQRKEGFVITFCNERGNWLIYQFHGTSVNQWNSVFCWDNIIQQALKELIFWPDEEDITSVKDGNRTFLKFKNREFNPDEFIGMGMTILRRNPVGTEACSIDDEDHLVNVLTQDMIAKPNTVYIIEYDFDLDGKVISIPENCTLWFQGGTLNNGSLHLKETAILGAFEFADMGNCDLFGTFNTGQVMTFSDDSYKKKEGNYFSAVRTLRVSTDVVEEFYDVNPDAYKTVTRQELRWWNGEEWLLILDITDYNEIRSIINDLIEKHNAEMSACYQYFKDRCYRLEVRMDNAETRLTNAETRLDGHDVTLSNHEQRIYNSEVRLTNVEERATNLENRATSLEERMEVAETDIDNLESWKENTVDPTLEDHEKRLTQAEKDIDALEGRMDTAEGDINSHSSQLQDHENRLKDHNDRITVVERKATEFEEHFTQVDDKLNNHDGTLSEHESMLKEHEEEIENIKDKLAGSGDVEGDITNIQITVNKHTEDITNINNKITTIEETINNLKENIENIEETITNIVEEYLRTHEIGGATSVTVNGTKYDMDSSGNITLPDYPTGTGGPATVDKLNHKLTFNGAVNAEFDGSQDVTVTIPSGGSSGPSTPTDGGTADKVAHKLKFTGASTQEYDGSSEVTVNIPTKPSSAGVADKVINKLIFSGAVDAQYDGSQEVTVIIPTGGSDSDGPTSGGVASKVANKLKFTGAVEAEYDGSAVVTVDIPTSASTLKNARTLWGQSFDGSKNITGDMTSVGHVHTLSNRYLGNEDSATQRFVKAYFRDKVVVTRDTGNYDIATMNGIALENSTASSGISLSGSTVFFKLRRTDIEGASYTWNNANVVISLEKAVANSNTFTNLQFLGNDVAFNKRVSIGSTSFTNDKNTLEVHGTILCDGFVHYSGKDNEVLIADGTKKSLSSLEVGTANKVANKLKFTGASTKEYDGHSEVSVEIPTNADTVDNYHVRVVTASQYASLTKDANTIYFVK